MKKIINVKSVEQKERFPGMTKDEKLKKYELSVTDIIYATNKYSIIDRY